MLQPASHQPGGQEAAAFINEQWVYAASALLAMHLGVDHPGLRRSLEPGAGDDLPTLEYAAFRRIDGTERIVSFYSSITIPLRRYWSRENFERTVMMGLISLVAAVLDDHRYFCRPPGIAQADCHE